MGVLFQPAIATCPLGRSSATEWSRIDGNGAIADQVFVFGLNVAHAEFVVPIPPQTKTSPSGSSTALARLRCRNIAPLIAQPDITAVAKAVTSDRSSIWRAPSGDGFNEGRAGYELDLW